MAMMVIVPGLMGMMLMLMGLDRNWGTSSESSKSGAMKGIWRPKELGAVFDD